MEISGKSFHINLRLENMKSQMWSKFLGIFYRVTDYLRMFPVRVARIFGHFWRGIFYFIPGRHHQNEPNSKTIKRNHIGRWWVELFFLIADVLGTGELYETIMDLVKFNTRPLYDWEIHLAKSVFGDTINYRRVRIDEYSFAGPKQWRFCYVSFYTINSWGSMQNSIFIHEMTHVWQFEKMGSVYIPRALEAQRSVLGYNYGGVEALKNCQEKGKSFLSFNLEQQGDIISDYYRIKDGYKPQWGRASRLDLPIYESFIDEVRNS